MKIIQSFAFYEEGNPYLKKTNKKTEYVYLNYYSFLLSYVTLKKQYGEVTMFCNQSAYEKIIKYIPYDNIIINENKNDFTLWSVYKLDSIRTIKEDFIHVDSDVFISNDVFKPYIEGDYDILVQNVVPYKLNFVKSFGFNQKEFLRDTKILTKPYDGKCFSCGTLGLRKDVQDYYFKGVDVLHDAMKDFGVNKIIAPAMLLEEQLLYYIALENDFTHYEILRDEIKEIGDVNMIGDKIGYLHMWFSLKYKKAIIQMIRKKLFFDFPDYIDYIVKYEKERMYDKKIFDHIVLPDKENFDN